MHFKKDNSPTDSPPNPHPKILMDVFFSQTSWRWIICIIMIFFNELLIQNNTRQGRGLGVVKVFIWLSYRNQHPSTAEIWWILWMLLVYDKDKTERWNVDNVHTTNYLGPSHARFSWCWRCWYFVFIFVERGGHNLFFFMLIMFSLHCSCCRVLRDKHAKSCYQTKT